MSNYRNNGAKPRIQLKREPDTDVEEIAPPPKRVATENRVSLSTQESTPRSSQASDSRDGRPDESVVYDANREINPIVLPKRTWVPFMPVCAKKNYINDPEKTNDEARQSDIWHFSPSLNGWVTYQCLFCGTALCTTDYEHVYNFRNGVPKPMATQPNNPPSHKYRIAPICGECLEPVTARCKSNPQHYNGRGYTVWILPI